VKQEYAGQLAWAEAHDAWGAGRRADLAAAHLGLRHLDRGRPVDTLSGGERTRLALAAIITRRPDCVLLDEPTNHLDDVAMAFVEEFVTSSAGVVVVASHDRVFLDNTAAVVVDLDPSHFGFDGEGGTRFFGDFTAYLAQRRRARRRWEEAFLAQRDELKALRLAEKTTARTVAHDRGPRDNDKYIYGFKGANVARTVARRVHNVERRIEAIERVEIPKPPRPLSFGGTLAAGSATVRVRDLVVPGRVSVERLTVASGQHLLVTGANGSGKSSLLAVLAGELRPARVEVQVHARGSATSRRTWRSRAPTSRRTRCMPWPQASRPSHRWGSWAWSTRASSGSRWACSAGSSAGSPSRSFSPGVRTCCSSTSRRTTSRSRSPRTSRRRSAGRRGLWSSRATTVGCADAGRARCTRCREGRTRVGVRPPVRGDAVAGPGLTLSPVRG